MYCFNTKEELIAFIAENVITSKEASEILGCCRQNIDDLVKRNKLKPIRVLPRDRLFFKEDVLVRKKSWVLSLIAFILIISNKKSSKYHSWIYLQFIFARLIIYFIDILLE